MKLHYISIYEYALYTTYSDHIIINDEQLALLKWFFNHFLDADGYTYNKDSDICHYTFTEDDPDYIGDYWEPFDWGERGKGKVVIYTQEFGFEFFTLTYNQIDMLEFLRNFLNNDYIAFVNTTEEKFPEIS